MRFSRCPVFLFFNCYNYYSHSVHSKDLIKQMCVDHIFLIKSLVWIVVSFEGCGTWVTAELAVSVQEANIKDIPYNPLILRNVD